MSGTICHLCLRPLTYEIRTEGGLPFVPLSSLLRVRGRAAPPQQCESKDSTAPVIAARLRVRCGAVRCRSDCVFAFRQEQSLELPPKASTQNLLLIGQADQKLEGVQIPCVVKWQHLRSIHSIL